MILFPFNENRFSFFFFFFFFADHLLVGQSCTNPKSDRSLLSCLKVTQVLNERDQRCAAVQLMLSTDPSYDSQNHRWIATNNRDVPKMIKTVSGYDYGFWCGFKRGPHHATSLCLSRSFLRSRLGSQHQSVPGCAEESGDPLVQSGGRWQTLGVAAGLCARPQVQGDQGLASEGVLRLCTLLSLTTWTHWTTSFGLTSRT